MYRRIKDKNNQSSMQGIEAQQEEAKIRQLSRHMELKRKKDNSLLNKKKDKKLQLLGWLEQTSRDNPLKKNSCRNKIVEISSSRKKPQVPVFKVKPNKFQTPPIIQRIFWRRWRKLKNITTAKLKFMQKTIKIFQPR